MCVCVCVFYTELKVSDDLIYIRNWALHLLLIRCSPKLFCLYKPEFSEVLNFQHIIRIYSLRCGASSDMIWILLGSQKSPKGAFRAGIKVARLLHRMMPCLARVWCRLGRPYGTECDLTFLLLKWRPLLSLKKCGYSILSSNPFYYHSKETY